MHPLSLLLLAIAANVDNLAVAIAYGIKRLRISFKTNLFIALVSALGTFLSVSVGRELGNDVDGSIANLAGSILLIAVGIWGIWSTLRRSQVRDRKTAVVRREHRALIAAIPPTTADSPSNSKNAKLESLEFSGSEVEAPGGEFPQTFSQEFPQAFSYENFIEHPELVDKDLSGTIDIRESIAVAFGLSLNNIWSGIGAGISELDVSILTGLVFGFSTLAIAVGYRLGNRSSLKLSGCQAGLLSGGLMIITGIYEYFVL